MRSTKNKDRTVNLFHWAVMLSLILLIFICWFAIAVICCGDISYAWKITAILVLYNIIIRLIVEFIVRRIPLDKFNPESRFYSVNMKEERIYKSIHIRKWRKLLPVLNPKSWDAETNGYDKVIKATCQAETAHVWDIISVFMFIPLLIKKAPAILAMISAITGAAVDIPFVLVQRCNRPVLIRLSEHANHTNTADI